MKYFTETPSKGSHSDESTRRLRQPAGTRCRTTPQPGGGGGGGIRDVDGVVGFVDVSECEEGDALGAAGRGSSGGNGGGACPAGGGAEIRPDPAGVSTPRIGMSSREASRRRWLNRMMFVPSRIKSPSFRVTPPWMGRLFTLVPIRDRLSSHTKRPSGFREIRACSASRSRPL